MDRHLHIAANEQDQSSPSNQLQLRSISSFLLLNWQTFWWFKASTIVFYISLITQQALEVILSNLPLIKKQHYSLITTILWKRLPLTYIQWTRTQSISLIKFFFFVSNHKYELKKATQKLKLTDLDKIGGFTCTVNKYRFYSAFFFLVWQEWWSCSSFLVYFSWYLIWFSPSPQSNRSELTISLVQQKRGKRKLNISPLKAKWKWLQEYIVLERERICGERSGSLFLG